MILKAISKIVDHAFRLASWVRLRRIEPEKGEIGSL
jgi:hypothetical protein